MSCKESALRRSVVALAAGIFLTGMLLPATAQEVRVSRAWVRAMVTGQSATGAYMELYASENLKLVSVSSPVAKTAEIHEMTMTQNVMKMRAVPMLDLPAGKPVDLGPRGQHIMLTGIAKPLKEGDIVPLTLKLEGKGNKTTTVKVQAVVRPLNAAAASDSADQHSNGHEHTH